MGAVDRLRTAWLLAGILAGALLGIVADWLGR